MFTTQIYTFRGHVVLKLVAPVAHLLFPGCQVGLSRLFFFRLYLIEIDGTVKEGCSHLPWL